MKGDFKDVMAVGFDLDQTLYPRKKEMDDRIRDRIAEKLLEARPALEDIEKSRDFFEEEYKRTKSGSKVIASVGYSNPTEIMNECLATANVLDFIKPDKKLFNIIQKLTNDAVIYLLTSSPEEVAMNKLEKLGVYPGMFDHRFYSDTPNIGSKSSGEAHDYALSNIKIPAKQIVYIGDNVRADIIPAKERGMKTIGVWSEIPEADYSVDHIHKIEGLLYGR